MAYTVQHLASLAHISVRTLHFYDKIGLLKPSYVKTNGYRYYEQKELLKLQQILFFRELEFSLEEIKEILLSPNFDTLEALQEQKRLLKLKKKRCDEIIRTINNTIITMKKKKKVQGKKLYAALSQDQIDAYKQEAKERWGHTEAYKQSEERTKHWTQADFERVEKEGQIILENIVKVMAKGPTSKEVQKEILEYHKYMGNFYDCSYEIFLNLGRMYSEDARFTEFYEKIQVGLAAFMTSALEYYCEQHSTEITK